MAVDRVVVLVDMDCFYVQVEQRDNPTLKGKPCAVVQYKTYKGGGGTILAVSYEARPYGVKRFSTSEEAREKYPDIELPMVPLVRGKAVLDKYREAGAEVIEVLSRFCRCVERASIDEAYLDLTEEVRERMAAMKKGQVTLEVGQVMMDLLPNTHVVGWEGEEQKDRDNEENKSGEEKKEGLRRSGLRDWLSQCQSDDLQDDLRLAVAAVITEEMRAAVYQDTGFRCSAGVAHNKMLSKLVCGLNKPNKQTVCPHASVPGLFSSLPLRKVRSLGGKLGVSVMEELQTDYMGELTAFSERELQEKFGEKSGSWLYNACRGIETEPVSARQLAKSIGCSKNFTGKEQLDTKKKVRYWMGQLCQEVAERLEKDKQLNKRVARSMSLHIRHGAPSSSTTASRAFAITRYDSEKFTNDAYTILTRFDTNPAHQASWCPAILTLGISAGKFEDDPGAASSSMRRFLSSQASPTQAYNTQGTPSQAVGTQASPLTQGGTQTPSSLGPHTQGVNRLKKTPGPLQSMFNAISEARNLPQSSDPLNTTSCDSASDEFTQQKDALDFYARKMEETKLNSVKHSTTEKDYTLDIQRAGYKVEPSGVTIAKTAEPIGFFARKKEEMRKKSLDNASINHNTQDNLSSSSGQVEDNHNSVGGENPNKTTTVSEPLGFFARKELELRQKQVRLKAEQQNRLEVLEKPNVQQIAMYSEESASKINSSASCLESCQLTNKDSRNSEDFIKLPDDLGSNDSGNSNIQCAQSSVQGTTCSLNSYQQISQTLRQATSASFNGDNQMTGSSGHCGGSKVTSGTVCSDNSNSNDSVCLDFPKLSQSDLTRCEKCEQAISAWDLPEHLDFHYAMELQEQQDLNDRPKPVIISSLAKRKSNEGTRGRPSKKAKLGKAGEGSLDQFFKRT